MAIIHPTMPAATGELTQYMSHTFNDSSIRFVLRYPGVLDPEVLGRAMKYLVDSVFVLHASFIEDAARPYWQINDGYTAADTVARIELPAGADVLEEAARAALRPVYFSDTFQLYCALVTNGAQSGLALVVSHLCADGGDAKYLLHKLIEVYNCLAAGGDPETVKIKNGDRDLLQIFERYDPAVLDEKPEEEEGESHAAAKVRSEFPFPEPNDVGAPRIVRRTIPAPVLGAARQRAKTMGATVNDLLLAAYYRAYARLFGLGESTPLSIMSMIDMRQYMEGKQSEGICNLSSLLPTTLAEGIGPDFTDTLAMVSAQTKEIKDNGLGGIHDVGRAQKVAAGVFHIPYRLLLWAGKTVYRGAPMGMTNLGNLHAADLAMGGIAPDAAFFASQVKKKPGMQLAVMSLDGVATLTVANECGERDAELLDTLLARIEDEVRAFGQSA